MSVNSVPLTQKLYDSIKEQRVFDCKNPTVNEFFYEDTWEMQKLYYLQTTLILTDDGLAGFYSVASDSLEVKPPEGEDVDRYKERFKIFPALKVQWLGINCSSQKKGLGTLLMKQIVSKAYLLNDNHGTGCRFVTLDAQYDFREPTNAALNPVSFYQKFGFNFCNRGDKGLRLKNYKAAKDAASNGTANVKLYGSVSMYFDILKLEQVL